MNNEGLKLLKRSISEARRRILMPVKKISTPNNLNLSQTFQLSKFKKKDKKQSEVKNGANND
jgi:hydroxymethylpyrimidine/phosphomethylpyrimidine kinase